MPCVCFAINTPCTGCYWCAFVVHDNSLITVFDDSSPDLTSVTIIVLKGKGCWRSKTTAVSEKRWEKASSHHVPSCLCKRKTRGCEESETEPSHQNPMFKRVDCEEKPNDFPNKWSLIPCSSHALVNRKYRLNCCPELTACRKIISGICRCCRRSSSGQTFRLTQIWVKSKECLIEVTEFPLFLLRKIRHCVYILSLFLSPFPWAKWRLMMHAVEERRRMSEWASFRTEDGWGW